VLREEYELCVITHQVGYLGRTHVDVAQAALEGGARLIQFRSKDLSTRRMVDLAREIRQLTREFGATFIINDRVEVALAVGADGVHVGEDDMPLFQARRLLGARAILGASVATVEAARLAEAAGADYLGVGPVFLTYSKADAGAAIGAERLGEIAAAVETPVIGIGGITADNAGEVVRRGAEGVAVISAVAEADDMVMATSELLAEIRAAKVLWR
jgi:thiamine-phosphate pyrophosphorylase